MDVRARLVGTRVPARPDAVVLVLHGGASRSGSPEVSPTQLSVVRMVPVARRVARAGRGRLAVYRLLNSSRGWDASHTPVDDVAWALGRLRAKHGDLPVGLVGHSLGGRAALLSAGRPEVASVVALAPWLHPDDGVPTGDRPVLVVHGDRDRIAPLAHARAVVARLARTGRVALVVVRGGTHAMLRRAGEFDGTAARFLAATLLGRPASGTAGRVLAGEDALQV